MKIYLSYAEHFLQKFEFNLTTLQVFPPIIDGKTIWPKHAGEYLCTGEKGSTALTYSGKLKDQEFLSDLLLLQKQRLGIYFMVNEGDGELHGHKIVRNSQAVTHLKALFVDTDEGNPRKLRKFCKLHKIKPHSIVESSPGKFHYYFLLEDTENNKENLFNWASCQHRLANIDKNYDDSMADVGRVLRIPGFYHTKKDLFLIKEIYESDHPPYRLDEMFDRIGAKSHPPRKGKTFVRPIQKIRVGNRHETLSSYLGSVSNTTRDSDVLLDSAIGFAQRNFQSGNEWLPDGDRFEELQNQVSYVLEERRKTDVKNSLAYLDTVTTKENFTKLPDEFYLKAPGIVGKMVRELCHYSAQPYPSFAFAASCALIGTLKAPFLRGSYRQTPPSTYFMCLAKPGRGKDFPREALTQVFIRLGFGALLSQNFRSWQGYLNKISRNNGISLVLHDETHHLFSHINRTDAEYIIGLKPHLLRLFSSANLPIYDPGDVVTDKSKIGLIPYPVLNYCGFGVPGGFEESFQAKELMEGLIPRFLILRDHQPVKAMSKDTADIPKKFKFEIELAEIGRKLRLMLETTFLDKTDNETPKYLNRKFVKIGWDDDAFQLVQNYSEKVAGFRNNGASEGQDTLQSRMVEHVNRLSMILCDSDEGVTKEIVSFCIKFVDHCYDNISAHIEGFGKGQGNKDLDKLIDFIAKRQKINKGPMQSQDLSGLYIANRHSLNDTIQLGIDLGKIEKIEGKRLPGITRGRLPILYQIIGKI